MNPYHLPGDPSLPPGCTHADIDRAFGPEPDESNTCEWCGAPCRHGTMCKRCIDEERAERKRDEAKDEPR